MIILKSRAEQLAAREAFVAGATRATFEYHGPIAIRNVDAWATQEARQHYPLPKVTRPRIVTATFDNATVRFAIIDGEFRFIYDYYDQKLQPRFSVAEYANGHKGPLTFTKELARLFDIYADLKANPTEEVDAE